MTERRLPRHGVCMLASEAPAQEFVWTPMTVVMVIVLIGGIIMAVGFRFAIMQFRRAAYKGMKAGLPGARKSYWLSLWSLFKMGALVVLVLGLMLWWGVNDVMDNNPQPTPATVSSPAKR